MLLKVVLVALASAAAQGQDAAPAKAPQLQTGLASFQERMQELQEQNRQVQEVNFNKINTSFNELVDIWKEAMASAADRYKRARLFNNSNINANNDLWSSFFNWLKNLLTPVPLPKDVTLLEKPNEDRIDRSPESNELLKEVRALLEALKVLASQQQEQPSEEEPSEEEPSEEEPSEEEPSEEEPSEEEPSEEEPSEEEPSEERPSEEQPSEEQQNTGGSIPQPLEGDNEAAGESEAEQPESQVEKQDEEQEIRPREEVVEETEDVQLPVGVDEETARLSAIVADSLQRAELTMLEIEAAVQAAVEAGLSHGNFRATEKSNDLLKQLEQLTAAFASSNADAAAALADIETKAEVDLPSPELVAEERKKVLQKWLLTINIFQVKLSEISIQVASNGGNVGSTPANPGMPEGPQPLPDSEEKSDNPFE